MWGFSTGSQDQHSSSSFTQETDEVADFVVHLRFIDDGAADFLAQGGAEFAAEVEGGLFHRAFPHAEGAGDLLGFWSRARVLKIFPQKWLTFGSRLRESERTGITAGVLRRREPRPFSPLSHMKSAFLLLSLASFCHGAPDAPSSPPARAETGTVKPAQTQQLTSPDQVPCATFPAPAPRSRADSLFLFTRAS